MKKIETYTDWLNNKILESEEKIYNKDVVWWELWKKENKEKYKFVHNALDKLYLVYKDEELLFSFDYIRNKIFTKQEPDFFELTGEVTKKELGDAENKADDLTAPEEEEGEKKDKKKDDKKEEKDSLDIDIGI